MCGITLTKPSSIHLTEIVVILLYGPLRLLEFTHYKTNGKVARLPASVDITTSTIMPVDPVIGLPVYKRIH